MTPTPCLDCEADCGSGGTGIREYAYKVSDEIWLAVGLDTRPGHGEDEFLCVGCLEKRLGRRLVPEDFPASALNNQDFRQQSARLRERVGH